MATKPTERILDWASGGTNTDPGSSKEAAGWTVSERPPAYWWNWILNSFGKWLSYFDTAISGGYQISSALDSGKYRAVTTQTTTLRGAAFAGSRMYVCSLTDAYMYLLADPYNPNNATYNQTLDLTADTSSDILHECIRVNADGTRLYSLGATNERLYQWTMSTPHSLSTASFDDYLALGTQDSSPLKFDISQDGTKIYVFGQTNDKVYRYTMTAWDLSTASFDTGQELALSATDVACKGLTISDDGTMLFTLGDTSTESVYRYDMSTAYDLTTASPTFHVFDVSGFTTNVRGMTFSPSGRRMFITSDTTPDEEVRMFYTGHIVAPEDV